MNTSTPEDRRYGEPDWEWRPVESRIFGGNITYPMGREHRDFPRYTEKSYEEWKLEGHIER